MTKGLHKTLPVFIVALCCAALLSTCASNSNRSKNPHPPMTTLHPYTPQARRLAGELKKKGIHDARVLTAIEKVPRHRFIDEKLVDYAYLDRPLPIDQGQTISQPYTVAYQTQLLELEPGEKVLEVGTGSGYQAAVLCEMGADVYSIERFYQLHLSAKETLNGLGYEPHLFYGDGFEGLPHHAPFDKILLTAAPVEIPKKLLQQLQIGGWLIGPLGGRFGQKMTKVQRVNEEEFRESEHGDFIFVPMQKGTVK